MADRTASRMIARGQVSVLAASIRQANRLCDGQQSPCGASCVCWQAASMEAVKKRRAALSTATQEAGQ